MKLTPHEIALPLWNKLTEHYTPILAKYRARIENPRITEADRIELAWRIAGIKDFLNLATPEEKKE